MTNVIFSSRLKVCISCYMTLNDAFSVLIAQPFWYKGSGYTKQYAYRDKKNFQNGKLIPEERMRHYLKTAGWEQTQEEQWEKDGK